VNITHQVNIIQEKGLSLVFNPVKTNEEICSTSSNALRVPILVEGNTSSTYALLDTGATIDAMSKTLYDQINPRHTKPYQGKPISVANRETMKPTNQVLVRLKILGKWIASWFVVIEGLSHDLILGLPFQHRVGIIVDCKNKQIHLTKLSQTYHYSYELDEDNSVNPITCNTQETIWLETTKGITIKPRSRNRITLRTRGPRKGYDGRDGLIVSCLDLPKGVKVFSGIATPSQLNQGHKFQCEVVLINSTNQALQLNKRDHIANFIPLGNEVENLTAIVLDEESVLTSSILSKGKGEEDSHRVEGKQHCGTHYWLPLTSEGNCTQCTLEINLINPSKETKGQPERTLEDLTKKPQDFENLKRAITEFRLTKTYLTDEEVYEWARMLTKYFSVWDPENLEKPIRRTDKVTCKIDLTDDIPVERRYTTKDPVLHEIERKHIQKMYERNVIQPSQSNYAQPIILADKKNGKIRFCVDYRGINAKTKKFCYPLPRMDDILITLGNAKYFSLIDQSEAFWSIPLDEESRRKTAFVSRSGLWEFLSMPFGLKNAPAMQQSFLDAVLSGLSWQCCICYVDDIVIFSNTLQEHLGHVQEILSRLQENNLTISPSKADICMPSFDILGFKATRDGLLPGDKHLKAIKDFPLPTTVKEVQAFLGLVNFLRRFIPNCSKNQRSLQRIIVLKKRGKVELGPEETAEFEGLKLAMQRYPALIHPDMRRPFYIHVDASGTGYGAILTQRTKDNPDTELTKEDIPKGITKDHQVVCYASIALPKGHLRYSNPEREASAIKWATETFKHYILGKQVVIFTDHQTFEYSISHRPGENITSKNQVIAKCAAAVQKFDPIVLHRPGTSMIIPDVLSRIHSLDRVNQKPEINAVTRAQARDAQNESKLRDARDAQNESKLRDTRNESKGTDRVDDSTNQERDTRDTGKVHEYMNRTDGLRAAGDPGKKRKRTDPARDTAAGNQRTSNPLEPPNTRAKGNPRAPTQQREDKESVDPKRVKRDYQKLISAQTRDPFCQQLRQYLTEGRIEEGQIQFTQITKIAERAYYDVNQVLRVKPRKQHLEQRCHQIVLPRELWETTIREYHEPPISGHRKYEKLIALLSTRYWFMGMRDYVKMYVKSCHQCQIAKPSITYEGKATPYCGNFPNHIIHLDFTKGTGITERGHTYIMAIIDNFTNFLRLYPIQTVNAASTANCLLEYITTFSCPVKMVCDNGTEFSNALLKAISTAMNISKCHISPYHSQANGKVENVHRNIKTMLRSYIENYIKDWDLLLPMLQLAHNSQISKATGYSPFYLMHGFPPILPSDAPSVQIPDHLSKDEYILNLQENLSQVFQFVRHHRALAMAKRAEVMDERNKHKRTTLHPGELVLMRSHQKQRKFNEKLLPKAQSEFFIIKDGDKDLYSLMDPHTLKVYPNKIHIGQLIRYNYRLSEDEQKRLGTTKMATQYLPTTKRIVDSCEDDNVYEVEAIRGAARMEDGSIMYQVKWKGYPFRPKNKNSWVEERDLYAPDLLRRYKNTPEFRRLVQGECRVT
tara:strand:- start:108 stop:4691 length:4584 start_codon:yes stop_codon:yes gene_type:complete